MLWVVALEVNVGAERMHPDRVRAGIHVCMYQCTCVVCVYVHLHLCMYLFG